MYGSKRKSGNGYKGRGSQGRSKKRRLGGGIAWFRGGGTTRKFNRGRPTQVTIPGQVGLPSRCFVKLRTNLLAVLSSTSGAFTTRKGVKLNSVNDPFGTLGSVVAIGVANWEALYHSYIVHSAALKIRLTNNSGVAAPQNVCFAPASNLQAVPTSMDEARGQPNSRYLTLGPSESNPPISATFFVTMAQVVGQARQAVAYDDSFSALTTTDPATLIVANISNQALDGTTSTACFASIELTQYVEFFGPRMLT